MTSMNERFVIPGLGRAQHPESIIAYAKRSAPGGYLRARRRRK